MGLFGFGLAIIIQHMDDDQFYNTDNISIVSKVKQPTLVNSYEDSLSRIIREQAINYQEENVGEDVKARNSNILQKRVVKTEKKEKYTKNNHKNPERVTYTTECYESREYKEEIISKRREKERKKQSINDLSNMRSMERRGNLLLFQSDPREGRGVNVSKKQKRTEKTAFQEQKTKKIEFQDIDRYGQEAKKEQPTKIRHQNYAAGEDNLGIESNQNSEHLMDSRDIGILSHRLTSNYAQIKLQIKQQIDMVKYLYIQTEKIDIRKLISKLEADIRRIKIGFRGLSESQGKANRLVSSIQDESRLRRKGEGSSSKVQAKSKRERPPPVQNYMKYAYDYGPQEQDITDLNPVDKLNRLEENYRSELAKENRFTSRLAELEVKYHTLRASNLRKEESLIRRTEISKSGSIVKRSKLLKDKIAFLKNEVKQTKAFYSNKIKRLRNENTILKNEDTYIQRQIEQFRQQKKQATKKSLAQANNSSNKHNLYLFDQTQLPQRKNYNISKVTSNKELISNIPSIAEIKSLQSINSVKSINLFVSKPSLGSINSYKSTKIESVEKKKSIELQNPMRNKLKINSPHHLSPPSMGELKQNSFLKRFKGQHFEGRGVASVKKATSLDIAIKQLQQKYSKMMQDNEDEYYR